MCGHAGPHIVRVRNCSCGAEDIFDFVMTGTMCMDVCVSFELVSCAGSWDVRDSGCLFSRCRICFCFVLILCGDVCWVIIEHKISVWDVCVLWRCARYHRSIGNVRAHILIWYTHAIRMGYCWFMGCAGRRVFT